MVQLITLIRLALSLAFPFIGAVMSPKAAMFVYLAAMTTDIADGSLARRWKCATRGGDWLDAFADRMLTTMSGVYGLLTGGSILACSFIIGRDLSAVSVNELQSEGSNKRARFLGIITVTPIRVVTAYVLSARLYGFGTRGVPQAYWACAVIAWSTFAINLWLRRAIIGDRFREPDTEKLLRW